MKEAMGRNLQWWGGCLLGSSLLLGGNAFAAWVPVASVPDQSQQIFLDSERMKRSGDQVEFWRRNLWQAPEADGAIGVDNQHKIDCKKGEIRWTRSMRFDASGRFLSNVVMDDRFPSAPIRPGSLNAQLYGMVCTPSSNPK